MLSTLFLPLSHDCRLARIWLSMADTQASLSSWLWASKCHVCPVKETMMKSAFSSSAGETHSWTQTRLQCEEDMNPQTVTQVERNNKCKQKNAVKPMQEVK